MAAHETEAPIRCEGRPEIAVELASGWLCARCGGVLLCCHEAPGLVELDGVHDSMFTADLLRRLRGRARRPTETAGAAGAVADDARYVTAQLGAVAAQPDGHDLDVVRHGS